MNTDLFVTWLTHTAYICGLPVVALLWAVGLRPDSGMEIFKDIAVFPHGHDDGLMLLRIVCTTAMSLFLLAIYPMLVTILTLMLTYSMLSNAGMDVGACCVNTIIIAALGWFIGGYTAQKVFERIDAHFGLEDGIGGPLKWFLVASTIYAGVKAIKVGKRALGKL